MSYASWRCLQGGGEHSRAYTFWNTPTTGGDRTHPPGLVVVIDVLVLFLELWNQYRNDVFSTLHRVLEFALALLAAQGGKATSGLSLRLQASACLLRGTVAHIHQRAHSPWAGTDTASSYSPVAVRIRQQDKEDVALLDGSKRLNPKRLRVRLWRLLGYLYPRTHATSNNRVKSFPQIRTPSRTSQRPQAHLHGT